MPDISTLSTPLQNALTGLLSDSELLNNLWGQFNGPFIMNALGSGTLYNGTSILIDPAMLPDGPLVDNQSRRLTYPQLATVIGHELAHAVLPNSRGNPIAAGNPDAALAVGEVNETTAYAAQYVIALQLSKAGQDGLSFFTKATGPANVASVKEPGAARWAR